MLPFLYEANAQEEERNMPAGQLIKIRCTKCHPEFNYNDKTHSRIGWTLVVFRMQIFNGAIFKRGERAVIIDYLAKTRPASPMRAVAEFFALILPILFALASLIYYCRKRSKKL